MAIESAGSKTVEGFGNHHKVLIVPYEYRKIPDMHSFRKFLNSLIANCEFIGSFLLLKIFFNRILVQNL